MQNGATYQYNNGSNGSHAWAVATMEYTKDGFYFIALTIGRYNTVSILARYREGY